MSATGFHNTSTSLKLQLKNLKLTTQRIIAYNNTSLLFMDNIFLLGEGDRSAFLQHMMQSFGCTYICLWSYLPQPSSCLLYLDGVFREVSNQQQPSSSTGSLARRLFNTYCESVNFIDNGRIPGFSFKNNLPYMELKSHDFQRMASSEAQLQFYQEAGIQTVVFMGCATGEIELGMPTDPQGDLEMEMKNWFPIDFSRPPATDQNNQQQPPSSSSSSLRSLSVDSPPEYSPHLLFSNISPTPTPPFTTEPPVTREAGLNIGSEALLEEAFTTTSTTTTITATSPHQQAIQALSQIRTVQFPTIESEDAAMTKAMLAVLSSSSSASHQEIFPPIISHNNNKPNTAFRSYRTALAPVPAVSSRKHNYMFRRAVGFLRNLNLRRRQELHIQGNRPTTTQLHHMISERRRREKLNESFQILRSLLPPGSKKDKASVLSSTTEYLSSLQSQVAELTKRYQMLEAELFMSTTRKESSATDQESSATDQRVSVGIENVVSASTSEGRYLDLRVRVRGECSTLDLVIRILEFLKQQRNVSLLSVESNTRMIDSTQVHGIMLRLKVEGDEFDEAGFQEAVRRVVDDLAR